MDSIWFQTPDDLDEVHAPGGPTIKPCGDNLADFAGFGTLEAAARCEDDRIRMTMNGGSWTTVSNLSPTFSLSDDNNVSSLSPPTANGSCGALS